MRKLIPTFLGVLCLHVLSAQTGIQFPGEICCHQELCPGEAIDTISESSPVLPNPPNFMIEYTWFQLVDNAGGSGGQSWVKIPNSNTPVYRPTSIGSVYGGFFMRAVRQMGTLPYQYSNIVTVKYKQPSEQPCVTATNDNIVSGRISVAPNPARDYLRIMAEQSGYLVAAYQLQSACGAVVEQQYALNDSEVLLDVAHYPSGIYLLTVHYDDGKKSVHKWVKW